MAVLAPAILRSHPEPFGPVDTIVADSVAELPAATNTANGSPVASSASDDYTVTWRVSDELQAFKGGINKPRSQGDRDEQFGERGASWKGVGG